MTVFSMPRATQAQSPLLSLPFELRTIILRDLLKQEEPLPHIYEISEDIFETILQLSAQLLHTCQQLYSEGINILYMENIVGINCSLHTDSFYFCILRSHIHSRSQCSEVEDVTKLNLLDLAKGDLKFKIDDDDDDDNESLSSQKSELMRLDEEERAWLLVNYATLKRFQRFHVLMQFRYEDEVLFACHALQDLLQGKDVSLKPRLLVHTESEAEKAARYLTAFQSFKYLRCSTFTIQGWPELEDIYSVITSQRPVPALLAQYVPFLRHLSTLPSLNDEVFELEHEIELEELKEHTVNPDPQKFREIVVQLVSKAEKWHTQSVEDEKARLEEERDLKLAAIADIVQLTEAELATSCEVQGSG